MSRRAGTERAAENQQTIKNLLKLEGNKVCADCKKNKRKSLSSQLGRAMVR
jgi:stromal membrane-associated protein